MTMMIETDIGSPKKAKRKKKIQTQKATLATPDSQNERGTPDTPNLNPRNETKTTRSIIIRAWGTAKENPTLTTISFPPMSETRPTMKPHFPGGKTTIQGNQGIESGLTITLPQVTNQAIVKIRRGEKRKMHRLLA